jgi:hypothetical protein
MSTQLLEVNNSLFIYLFSLERAKAPIKELNLSFHAGSFLQLAGETKTKLD